jgi:hypothetical protein
MTDKNCVVLHKEIFEKKKIKLEKSSLFDE